MFDLGKTEKDNDLAQTTPPDKYWIKITFNKNTDWNDKPEIIIAYTFIHEILHAEMYRQLLSVANDNGSINMEKIKEYAKKNKKELFNEYVKTFTNGNYDYQHELMAKKYIEISVEFLKEIYNNQYTDLEYKTVVWMSSLMGTTVWKNLPEEEKKLYKDTFNNNYDLWEK